ncbi:phasin family protein [Parvibacter caecicola]|uniref:phasin family protein n=1 Tax=Parvibacter caecicola TaxID=747645 RepID=UPI0023F0BD7F|nr:hypothetical protein [Parvibacter caecicola]
MDNVTDAFKNVFLAGVGALALGAEKSKELVDDLVAKGQITVEQGKDMTDSLVSRGSEATARISDELLAARLRSMTKEQRDEYAAKVAQMAVSVSEEEAAKQAEVAEAEAIQEQQGEEAPAAETVDAVETVETATDEEAPKNPPTFHIC